MSEQFIMIEKTFTSKDGKMKVCRTRTSKGFASISVFIEGRITNLSFTNELDEAYEFTAMELSDLLEEAAGDPCNLPKVE